MSSARYSDRNDDVVAPNLPGGSLARAILDRKLGTWSDRGGASQHIGERWAQRCAHLLENANGSRWPIPGSGTFQLLDIIRLDDSPEVSTEANEYQLENPDFILIGKRNDENRLPVLQAADAKFAADRIKASQVSTSVVSDLLNVPDDGITRSILANTLDALMIRSPDIVPGVFLCPDSYMTDYLLERSGTRRGSKHDVDVVVTVPAEPASMFEGLPMMRLIGTLARIDHLAVTPGDNIIAMIYYFRAACACFYFWRETHEPLLTNRRSVPELEPAIVCAELSYRAASARSSYDVLYDWSRDAHDMDIVRQKVSMAAKLPVTMREIRALVANSRASAEKRILRNVRRDLELEFRDRLIALTGEITVDDSRPLHQIVYEVKKASEHLRDTMYARARVLAAP